MKDTIAVLGAGSWGTALAVHCARVGHAVRLWGRDASLMDDIARTKQNASYMPMTEERLEELDIPQMVPQNTARFETAFCISIEAKYVTSTGISAADRAATVLAAIDPKTRPSDLARPGHMGALKEMKQAREQVDEKQMLRVEAIINSMTAKERRNHQLINGQRRKRIARGSGTSVEEVNRLLKQFIQMKKMLKAMGGMAGLAKGKRPNLSALKGLMR